MDELENIKMICPKYQIKLMILFGSYNTEKYNSNSDIDIAIQIESKENIYNIKKNIIQELSLILKREIDLVILNYADPLLKFQVANNGRLVFEKIEGIYNTFKVNAIKEYYDARKFFKLEKKVINNYIKGDNKNGRQRVSPPQVK